MMWIKSKDGLNLCNAEEIVLFSIERKGNYERRKYYLRALTKQSGVLNISVFYSYAEAKEALKFFGDQLIPPQTNTKLKEMEADNHGDT